jgi:hypothetical protein
MIFMDLLLVAKSLPNKSEYKTFKGAVERLHSAISALHDLEQAHAYINILVKHTSKFGEVSNERNQSDFDANLGGALFTSAVIAYCRAMHTKPISGRWPGLAKLIAPEWRAMDRRILTVRNEALAHKGPGGEDYWNREAVVLWVDPPDQSGISVAMTNFYYKHDLIEGMFHMLVGIKPLIKEEIEKRNVDMKRIMNVILSSDGDFSQILLLSRFDPHKFFTTKLGADKFITSLGGDGFSGVPSLVPKAMTRRFRPDQN